MRILFLVNDVTSPPGVLLEEAQGRGAECDVRVIHYGFGDPKTPLAPVPETAEGHDGLVVMGGPMGVYEAARYPFIEETRALIRRFHAGAKPVMGVCLGGQLVASAFGADVRKMEGPDEFGFLPQTWLDAAADDALLHDAEPDLPIVQWHQDTFDIPRGAVQLSTRKTCRNQSFRLGRNTYAFQFHLELTRETLEVWIGERAKLKNVAREEIAAAIGPVERVLDPQQAFTRRVMSRWMALGAGVRS
ncbi:MAG: type 1 glutamine amidotransferase [Parvibaculum sp.]|uniref:type 1 glutamine amidotransferase n=1 Tax=Parvibaculum sp. TaxID=2024848 RepID=UPI00283CA4E2|nr:type 1 glutamine amidotransferase [Parvibaculum sp.]MDR3498193.1 type 1 glutamine amidotransferase [Parvibaculum sp.]